MTFKGQIKVSEFLMGCIFWMVQDKSQIKVSEFLMGCIFWMVHVMTKVYMKHI